MSTRLGPTHPRGKRKSDLVIKRDTTVACFEHGGCGGGDSGTREAGPDMTALFATELHDEFGGWALAYIPSEFGELQAIAAAVGTGDDDAFYRAWVTFGDRLVGEAQRCLAQGHETSARESTHTHVRQIVQGVKRRDGTQPNRPRTSVSSCLLSSLSTWRASRGQGGDFLGPDVVQVVGRRPVVATAITGVRHPCIDHVGDGDQMITVAFKTGMT